MEALVWMWLTCAAVAYCCLLGPSPKDEVSFRRIVYSLHLLRHVVLEYVHTVRNSVGPSDT